MNLGLTPAQRSSLLSLCSKLGLDSSTCEKILECTGFALLPNPGKKGEVLLAYSTRAESLLPRDGGEGEIRILAETQPHPSHLFRTFLVNDPSLVFWSLVQHVNTNLKNLPKSTVHRSARVETGAYIAPRGVEIGENSVIGVGSVLLPGVTVGDNSNIGPNCVIGGDGFMIKETTSGTVRITHDAGVHIGNEVTLGALVNIDSGLFGDTTRVEHGLSLIHI